MVDGEMCNVVRIAQPDIDRNAAAAIVIKAQTTPAQHASTIWTEMDFERGVGLSVPHVDTGFALDPDALILVIIRPKRAIAATQCAVASGDRTRITAQGPACFSAVA